jgi:hypothetical protein
MTDKGFARLQLRCRNVSASGIGLLHNKPVKVGTELVVILPGTIAEPVYLACVVVYCHRPSSDVYSIGARITKALTDDDFRKLTMGMVTVPR